MAIAVTAGVNDRRVAPFGHRQETVRRAGRVDGVNRHFDGAVGTVLETNRARQAGRQLAVYLGFRGTCTDRAPAHQIRQVLRGDHVEEFPRSRQAAIVDIQQ
ncbi:hypothetical protein D3C79_959940 [compost metagenome]